MLNIILVKSFEEAKKVAQEIKPVCAIEAEYGEKILDENFVDLSLFHHGKYEKKPCPSIRWDIYYKLEKPFDNFIISHIDADTIFGIMWASKILKPTKIAKKIARIVACADIFGFHFVEKNILPKLNKNIFYRYLAIGYYINNLNLGDNQQTVIDVSKLVHKTILKIKDAIIEGPNDHLKNKIDQWLKNKKNEALKDRLIYEQGIQLFNSNKNLLSAYCLEDNCAKININLNTNNGSLTISAFDKKIVKKYFSEFENGLSDFMKYFYKNLGLKNWDEAGGRFTVAGSPRNFWNNIEIAKKLFKIVLKRVKEKDLELK